MSELWGRFLGHTKNKERFSKILQERRLPSTHIFVGPSGVGKRTFALALAQKLICQRGLGCGVCGPCIRVEKAQSENLLLVEPDGKSIKVSQSTEILKFVSFQLIGSARVVIINQAHKMNPQAANALLKTLEEPEQDTYFFLVTETLLGMLPTIRSRSLVTQFGILSNNDVQGVLTQNLLAFTAEQVQFSEGSVVKAMALNLETQSHIKVVYHKLWEQFFKTHKFQGSYYQVLEPLNKDIKDKDFMVALGQYFQKHLQSVWKAKDQGIHGQSSNFYNTSFDENLTSLSYSQLDSLFLESIQLEKDFKSNVDPSLCIAQFFKKANEVVSGQH
ncbi:MAG: AAA family ATPase [Bdellovibrionaceae bacterium]|nr:AAA family ATPase [Pseudobdellovibrionaceae bacterium]